MTARAHQGSSVREKRESNTSGALLTWTMTAYTHASGAGVLWIFLVACCLLIVRTGAEEDDKRARSDAVNRVDALRAKTKLDLSSADDEHPIDAAFVAGLFSSQLEQRLEGMYAKTTTNECRAKIATHLGYFVNALALEEALPFTDVRFPNECGEPVYSWDNLPEGKHIGDVQNRTYQPPRNETEYIDDPAALRLLYAILTHDNPAATIRLIEALYEPNHQFVIHVDAKFDQTQAALLEYAANKDYVHILSDPYRVRVIWGGFTMVNATLQTLKYAFAVEDSSNQTPMSFHKFVHLSSSSYPLASNPEIRHRLASYPLDANFLHVILQPLKPSNYVWHYFVECDDSLHRIYQLPPLSSNTSGADLFTSSQWFVLSRDFAQYLAEAVPGSFVDQYLRYIEHVVVADETFFGTVLRHTKYCHHHHNTNFLHLQFDRWESELPATARDPRKCPMPDPDHCGRSPTTMTLDYVDILELSTDLFARKFDDSVDKDVKDVVDQWRAIRAHAIEHEGVHPGEASQTKMVEFAGLGTLIVAKETVNDPVPLCLAIPKTGNEISLLPCFEELVPPTLASDWEIGAVVLSETMPHTRWEVGPCTSDGEVERLENGSMNVTLGEYSKTGPRCMLQQMDGMRAGRCYDSGSTSFQPGGETQVYPCVREWFQFVSFGDGRIAPSGSLFSTIPRHIVNQIHNLGHEQIPYMCLGVSERGNEDELDWDDEEYQTMKEERATRSRAVTEAAEEEWEALSEWQESSIITTQCTNTGAVIEWVFVPFIDEEGEDADDDDDEEGADTTEERADTAGAKEDDEEL